MKDLSLQRFLKWPLLFKESPLGGCFNEGSCEGRQRTTFGEKWQFNGMCSKGMISSGRMVKGCLDSCIWKIISQTSVKRAFTCQLGEANCR